MIAAVKMGRLEGKVAIVTGGARGIGRAFCLGLAAEGAKVVIADIDLPGAQATAKEITGRGGQALGLKTDVSDPQSTQDMAKKTVERFGRIDVLVNNAALHGERHITRAPFWELSLDEWDRVIAVNLKGVLLCSRAVFPQMKAQGAGKIINISSGIFQTGFPNYAHYVASKAGVMGLTRAMTPELGEFGINVNAIAPGSTLSEDPSDQSALKIRQAAIAERALKRLEYPEDLVGTAIFLASRESDFITGQSINVNGGAFMQ